MQQLNKQKYNENKKIRSTQKNHQSQ